MNDKKNPTCLRELAPGGVAGAEVAEGEGLAGGVLELPGDVEVAVVVDERHLVEAERLVGHRQVAVRRRLRAAVVHLLRDVQLLLVVLDGLRMRISFGVLEFLIHASSLLATI